MTHELLETFLFDTQPTIYIARQKALYDIDRFRGDVVSFRETKWFMQDRVL